MARDWSKLTELLEQTDAEKVTMTLDEIAECVGDIPDWIRKTPAAWRDDETRAFAWVQCGRTAVLRTRAGEVDFEHQPTVTVTEIPAESVTGFALDLRVQLSERGQVSLNEAGQPDLAAFKLHGPGVYAFTLRRGGEATCYIGEGENLTARMGQYEKANPASTKTNLKVHRAIVDCVNGGGQCYLDVVFEIVVDGAVLDFNRPSTRRLVENALLVHLRRDGTVCLNVDDFVLEDS
jgi:hypothetical protein